MKEKSSISLINRLKGAYHILRGQNGETAVKRNTLIQKWLQPVYTAWMGVKTHKLRSSLTILGVVIGVGAVISLMSIGRGTQANIVSSVQGLGSNLLFISPGSTTVGGVRGGTGSASTLSMDDTNSITEKVQYIVSVAPVNSSRSQVIAGATNTNASIYGITPEYQQVLNLQMAEGSFINEYQNERAQKVAVIGSDAKETLFENSDAVGQQLRIGSVIVTVIGVMESKGQSMVGRIDDSIFIPMTTFRQAISATRTSSGSYSVSQILISMEDTEHTDTVTSSITSLLRANHRLAGDDEDDFSITSQEDLVATIKEATGSMTLLLGAIAAISLLVGGIGVMNIMLVSVIERTREIGIRKALGAQERDIWMQFLIEAAMLTLTGGIIGIVMGWVVSILMSKFGGMTTLVSADIIILALSVSVGIGVFFGFYPAWQASRLNPIDALRSE